MNQHPTSNQDAAARGSKPADMADAAETAPAELVTVRASQLQDGAPLPMNFIVLPQAGDDGIRTPPQDRAAPPAAAPAPPVDELPVLTVRAEPPAPNASVEQMASDASAPDAAFAATAFGPGRRQTPEPPLHADPDSAPASVAAAAAAAAPGKKTGRLLLAAALLLLLALAAVAWWWVDQHGLTWPSALRIALLEQHLVVSYTIENIAREARSPGA